MLAICVGVRYITTVIPYEKEIIDMLYEKLVDLGFTFGYALAGKKILGIKTVCKNGHGICVENDRVGRWL